MGNGHEAVSHVNGLKQVKYVLTQIMGGGAFTTTRRRLLRLVGKCEPTAADGAPAEERRRLCFPASTSNPALPSNSYRRFRLVCRNGSSGFFFNTKLPSGGEAVNKQQLSGNKCNKREENRPTDVVESSHSPTPPRWKKPLPSVC